MGERETVLEVVVFLLFLAGYVTAQQLPSSGAIDQQVIFAPLQFTNATQWGIGVGATLSHDACFVVGYNYTDGRAFAQYYEQDANQLMQPTTAPIYGDVMTGFDTTEMNPAGALLTTDKKTFIWSISTINDSNIAYGFGYVHQLVGGSWVLTQSLFDPIAGANRLYGGALAGPADGSLFAIGAAYWSPPANNTIPSSVYVWARNASGGYTLEHNITKVENRTGLYAYSLAFSENKRWVGVGAWNFHPRSVFLYDRLNNYAESEVLSPFGDITRFSYSMGFSPDGEWLGVGVFQYPSPGFVGAVVVFRFNATLDTYDPNNYYFLTTSSNITTAPGQGASITISNNYTVGNETRWSLIYGMPYYLDNGGASVWTFTQGNWSEVLPPLMGFGNLTGNSMMTMTTSSFGPKLSAMALFNWRSSLQDNTTGTPPVGTGFNSLPFLDLGWSATANRMISYDGCSAFMAGISNVGVAPGFVFRWLNITEGCPRAFPLPPVTSPTEPPTTQAPVEPPTEPPPPATTPPTTETTVAAWSISVIGAVFVVALLVAIFCRPATASPVSYYS